MIAFLHASRFCASCGSSWCCLKSLRTLSIHLSLGLPRGLFPPTFIVVTLFATCVSSLLITWPCHVEYHREKDKVVKWYGHVKRIGEGHVQRRMLDAPVPGEGERNPDGN